MSKYVDFLLDWFGVRGGRDVGNPYQHFISDPNQFLQFFSSCIKRPVKPCYMSTQPRRQHNTILGIEKIFLDFDDKESPPRLEKVWSEVESFTRQLIDRFNLEPFVVYSGNRGYHLYLWLVEFFEAPGNPLNEGFYKNLRALLIGGIQLKFLCKGSIDVSRLSRVPYSTHEETGKKCVPLTIRGEPYETTPDIGWTRWGGGEKGIPKDICAQALQQAKDQQRIRGALTTFHQTGKVHVSKGKRMRPCLSQALTQTDQEHLTRLAIALEYLHVGLSVDQVIQLFSNQPDFDLEKTRYYIEKTRESNAKPFRRLTLQQIGICKGHSCKACYLIGRPVP